MKAVILAAGHGSRLRLISENIPKPMVPVAGRPLLEYTVRLLKKYGVENIFINLHYFPEVITSYFDDGKGWGVNITYSWEKKLLGTAGAVKKLETFLKETFLVIYGDNLSNCNIARLCDFHSSKNGIATIALHRREDPTSSGIVKLDKNCRITKFLEKPRIKEIFSNLVNAGILVLEPEIMGYIPQGRAYDFGEDVFPQLLQKGEVVYGYAMEKPLLWVDTPEDYRNVQTNFWKGFDFQ